jgi:16S rRNA (adenine1518-N6/adenine1519-N6)-dimethyltransferase
MLYALCAMRYALCYFLSYTKNGMVSIYKELEDHGLIPKKRLGQHFLIDQNILNKVIRTAQIGKEDIVLEVGPGLGEMTRALAREAKRVLAIEIDPKLVEILKKKLGDYSNINVIEGDVLTFDFIQCFGKERQRIKVVANLPYQISTPLLFRFIESRKIFSTLTLMVQKEVAERMIASPGSKAYGSLSIFIQLFWDLSIRFFIKPTVFFPPPRVDSAVVHIVSREMPRVELRDEDWFNKVVRGCFGYRRKTLLNGLKHCGLSLPKDVAHKMENIGIDPRRRPETLTIEEFANLAEALKG